MHQASYDDAVGSEDPMLRPKLKLVKLDGPLGDLSGMPMQERAELVAAQGQQRLLEDRARDEAQIWKKAFWAWGLFAGGFSLLFALQESADAWSFIRKSWLSWVWGSLCFAAFALMMLTLPLVLLSSFRVILLTWRKAQSR